MVLDPSPPPLLRGPFAPALTLLRTGPPRPRRPALSARGTRACKIWWRHQAYNWQPSNTSIQISENDRQFFFLRALADLWPHIHTDTDIYSNVKYKLVVRVEFFNKVFMVMAPPTICLFSSEHVLMHNIKANNEIFFPRGLVQNLSVF